MCIAQDELGILFLLAGKNMTFPVVTYNILALGYINPAGYPHRPALILEAEHRMPVFIRHIIDFTPDILCLQEVEASVFELLGASLYSLGYVGLFIQKAQDKPDEE